MTVPTALTLLAALLALASCLGYPRRETLPVAVLLICAALLWGNLNL